MMFTVAGKSFELDAKEVERKMKGVDPEPIQKVYVLINGERYPVKQALAVCVGLMRVGFTTQHAFHVFQRLGFKLGEI